MKADLSTFPSSEPQQRLCSTWLDLRNTLLSFLFWGKKKGLLYLNYRHSIANGNSISNINCGHKCHIDTWLPQNPLWSRRLAPTSALEINIARRWRSCVPKHGYCLERFFSPLINISNAFALVIKAVFSANSISRSSLWWLITEHRWIDRIREMDIFCTSCEKFILAVSECTLALQVWKLNHNKKDYLNEHINA